jgi:hypothetical protein
LATPVNKRNTAAACHAGDPRNLMIMAELLSWSPCGGEFFVGVREFGEVLRSLGPPLQTHRQDFRLSAPKIIAHVYRRPSICKKIFWVNRGPKKLWMECKRAKNNGEAGDRNLGLPHVRIESCKADALPLSHIPESICVVLNYDETRNDLIYILSSKETAKSLPLFFPANHRALTFTWRILGPSVRFIFANRNIQSPP